MMAIAYCWLHREVLTCFIPTAAAMAARADTGITVREPSSGVEFPLARTFWVGDVQRNLGAAVRSKKFAFVGVKVPMGET